MSYYFWVKRTTQTSFLFSPSSLHIRWIRAAYKNKHPQILCTETIFYLKYSYHAYYHNTSYTKWTTPISVIQQILQRLLIVLENHGGRITSAARIENNRWQRTRSWTFTIFHEIANNPHCSLPWSCMLLLIIVHHFFPVFSIVCQVRDRSTLSRI